MTITQLIQSSSAKANELFTKLADTSDGAVKTREKLLSELKDELESFARSQEQHLFPVLRKHKETKDLVPGAIDDSKQVRKLLAELEQMPKNDEGFAGKVAELKKVFQQHVRDEKKELLPAVRKALSDEEAQSIAETIETEKADAEEAKRQEAEQRRAEARRAREETERREAEAAESERQTRRTTATVTRLTESMARTPLRTAETGIDAAAEATRQGTGVAAQAVERTVERAAAPVGATARALRGMAQPASHGAATFAKLPGVVATVASDANRVWVAWMGRTAETGLRASQGLMGLRSPQQIAEVQGRFVQETLQAWMDVNREMMRISVHASEEMLQSAKRPDSKERTDGHDRR